MKYAPHTHTNDNKDPWNSLAAVTARVVSKLAEDKKPEGAENGTAEQRSEADEKQHREYVDCRLSELAEFEARARGVRTR
jgi:hypothetical protein